MLYIMHYTFLTLVSAYIFQPFSEYQCICICGYLCIIFLWYNGGRQSHMDICEQRNIKICAFNYARETVYPEDTLKVPVYKA